MKKLLSFIVMLAPVFAIAQQPWISRSFLADNYYSSIVVSNAIRGWTNLTSVAATTNYANLWYTNSAGALRTTGTNSTADAYNAFVDVPLWDMGSATLANASTMATNIANANITIVMDCESGANAAVLFRFIAMPDGVNESTLAGDVYPVSVTAVASSRVVHSVKVPAQYLSTVGKLRLRDISNADEDATSNVKVHSITINGYGN